MMRLTRNLILLSFLGLASCVNKEIPTGPNCEVDPMQPPTTVSTEATSCTASDGTIEVTAVGGIEPYQYQLGNGVFVANNIFTGLTAGQYAVTVQDSRGCTNTVNAAVGANGSTLTATIIKTPDNSCLPPHDGSITVSPSGGVPPYEIKFGDGAFGSTDTFTGLATGVYPVTVRDAAGCLLVWDCIVEHGDTQTSYSSEIVPLLNTFCNSSSCHGTGNGSRSWTSYANVAAKAQQIKLRTTNLSMPPSGHPALAASQIQIIACWVDDGAKNN